jgi:subtilisin family serine protease
MRSRRGLAAAIATLLLLVHVSSVAASVAPPGGSSGGSTAAPIDQELQRDLKAGTARRMVVEFKARADLKPAARVKDHTKRGQAVLNALVTTANGSQRAAKVATAATDGVTATSYWLTNVLIVEGDAKTLASLAAKLAKDPKVSAIRGERIYPLIAPIDPAAAVLAAAGTPEWGVDKIGADEAWEDGVLGQGVVVANVDTGVDYLHPALVEHYRGNNGDGTFTHDYNWFDPTGICGVAPCDNAAHGTHTMGTMVGGDGPGPFTPDTGVAPGAEWIAAKGCEDLGCSESALLGAGQFVLAPTDVTGNNPDPSKRPDIVNNSWGSGPGDSFYLETVQAWRMAGIIPVFSSGNPGPFCGEGGSPGDHLESFSVGATDDADLIAEFSGRGPSVFGKINPDVTAPGVDVVSTVPGGGYQAFSGTSMAAPHVAGALALMLSADEALRGDFAGATNVLRQTAVDRLDDTCGGDEDGDPNNVYGDGRIDAHAAVALVATGGTLAGTITDSLTDDPIAGARVTANDGTRDFSVVTGSDGTYELLLAAGTYDVSATAFGYFASTPSAVVIETDQTTTENIALQLLPRFTLSGTVTAAEDGSPLADVSVRAVGTPVAPVTTNGAGAYSLELPIGTYTIRASADGCTETGTADISSDGPDVTQDFVLFRKLDDFGHACAPTAFDWVDAQGQTALFGDEIFGRLRLPFPFEFYEESYDAVFLSDNGYLNFLEPEAGNFIPSTIPSSAAPNAAIYPLWMDLHITEVGSIDAQTVGDAFVIEFSQVRVFGTPALLDFEVKLWQDGTIDLLYGSNAANPGDGRLATIGIENETGTDALQIGFFERNLDSNQAIRITRVPTGLVTGTVTDANSGLPIAGAEVTATPGGRHARTAADGTYTLRLLPGSYGLTASKRLYTSVTASASVVDGGNTVRDFSLAAPTASVSPTEIDASVEFGSTTTAEVTIANDGSAPLTWETLERDQGVVTPPLPRVDRAVKWVPGWHRQILPRTFPRVHADAIGSAPMATIIVDPTGDGTGSVDVETVRGGTDGTTVVSMALDYSGSTPITQTGGYIFLDIDEDPTTGVPAPDVAGLETQDVGMEYFLDLFSTHDAEPVALVVDALAFEIVAAVPVTFDGQSMVVDIPLEALGGDDGRIATAMVLGDFQSPSDWAPDVGHGTIEPFTDASWLSPAPTSGEIAAGESAVVTVTLGAPGLAPGSYTGTLFFLTNAPTATQVALDVALDVALPDGFGQVDGFVFDAHSGEPIAGATLTMHAEWPAGTPLDLVATTDATGAYTLIGPDGLWSTDVTLAGYVPIEVELEIVGGGARSGGDLALHRIQPHAVLGGDTEPVLLLPPGREKAVTVLLGNPDGHANLHFTVGEVDLGPAVALAGADGKRSLPAGIDPNARTTRALGSAAKGTAVPPRIAADGDIVASWPTGMTLPWGVAFSGDVWLGDPIDLIDVRFSTDGTREAEFAQEALAEWGADMAFDRARDLIWQVNVGGDNGIYGLDPADGSVEHVITGSPWDDISQRGLAYDPEADVFYIGGWNEGVIYKVAGLSHDTPGATLSQCSPPDPGISGLAWNGSFGLLWEATNSETDTIWLVDPVTCDASRAIAHPDGGGFGGAGIELDRAGNLWTVGQNSTSAYLVESGLPDFSDVSWLTIGTTEGTLEPDATVNLGIQVDTTGLAPGVYRAIVAVVTDDPLNPVLQVPVTVVVPAFQRGVNAGGARYVDNDGDVYLVDRPWVARIRDGIPFVGPYGYEGPGAVRKTTAGIRGTTEDGRYRDQREAMDAYRFTVEPGVYQVELSFAELQFQDQGDRVFNVTMEGERVLHSVDVVEESGSWRRALDLTFIVFVEDGVLDIEFDAPRGHKAIVNAIFISRLPEGSPGT